MIRNILLLILITLIAVGELGASNYVRHKQAEEVYYRCTGEARDHVKQFEFNEDKVFDEAYIERFNKTIDEQYSGAYRTCIEERYKGIRLLESN